MPKPSRPPWKPSQIKARRSSAAAALLLLAATPALPGDAAAPPEARRAELKERRDELRGRLETLRRDLAKSEESRGEAADQLRGTETAISAANRRLYDLGRRRAATQAELAALEAQSKRLGQQIAAQQTELSRLLFRRTLRGDQESMQLLLAGRDPNQAARDYHFLTLLSRAKADLIGDLRANLAEKRNLAAATRDKEAELAGIERDQLQQRGALLARQKQRQVVLAQIAGRVTAQRHEIDTMRRSEQRLARLIDQLAKVVARPAPPRRAAKPPRPASTAALEASPRVDPASADADFARLRGHLIAPVHGAAANRFGAPRAEGGALWKGLFIRAAEGSEVHAVAAGQVVYADWLRGFGNLLIVDHGDGFLSIYGNNQSLLRDTGDTVKSGEVLATVGNSGGNPESGLYFELRHQGQPFDPSRWVSLR